MSAAGQAEPADLQALFDRVAAKAGALARLGGVDLAVSLRHGSGALGGDAARIEDALLMLLMNALTQTPRGGRVALVGTADQGGVRIELGTAAPNTEPRGLPDARCLVELGCGAATAQAVRRAQALLVPDGGAVALARGAGARETVTIRLPAAA